MKTANFDEVCKQVTPPVVKPTTLISTVWGAFSTRLTLINYTAFHDEPPENN